MKDRIKRLMESQHLSQQSFADKLQISPASLSSIFNDRTKPTLNHVDAIMKSFPGLNILWLLYGQGEMFASPENSSIPVNDPQPQASQTVGDLFDDRSFPTPQAPPASARPNIASMQFTQQPVETTKIINKPQRQITEIRIFYDDQTWETFVPKK